MRTTTALVLLGLCFQVNAQSPYRPFPESDAGWVELQGWMEGVYDCVEYRTVSCTRPIQFGNDTLLNGLTYHRLLAHGYCDWDWIVTGWLPQDCWPPSGYYTEPQFDFAFFRQDTSERKVWAFDMYQGEEILLYDFNIGLGPYPPTYNNHAPGLLQVVALDSVELNDGWHRSWVLGFDQGGYMDSAFCKVIEGVGSTFGLTTELVPPFEGGGELLCHQAGGVPLYPLGQEQCVTNMGVGPSGPPGALVLRGYPDPTAGPLTITGDIPYDATYVLMDAYGCMLGTGRLVDRRIDLAFLPPSPYLVRINAGDGRPITTLRVVKVD